MSAGEVIFIPQYWAHQVRNVDETLAVSYNFLDDYSIGTHAQLLMASARASPPRPPR